MRTNAHLGVTAPKYPTGYTEGIDEYIKNLQHDSGLTTNTNSVAAQYGDAEGAFANYIVTFGGATTYTKPYPPNGCKYGTVCLSGAQVEQAVKKYAEEHPGDDGFEGFLAVLLPPEVVVCMQPGQCSVNANNTAVRYLCAYHESVTLSNEKAVIYSVDAYVSGNRECVAGREIHPPAEGAISGGLSHELLESITDPVVGTGWYDSTNGAEIGDKCNSQYGEILPAGEEKKYNQIINGVYYYYQEEWSDFKHECMLRLGVVAHEASANFTVKAGPSAGEEQELVFEAEANPFAKYYDWRIQLPNGEYLPTEETTTPRFVHKFPTNGGLYVVALTVFEAGGGVDGGAVGSARTIYVPSIHEEVLEPRITKPARVVVGSPLTFSGEGSTDPTHPIQSYRWVIQNTGTIGELPLTGSGETFTTKERTIEKPGRYRLTLTVEDSIGQRASHSELIEAKREQTVAFTTAPPASPTVGSRYLPKASASSGLPVKISVAVASAAVCRLEGEEVVATAPGTCTLEATQEGNGEYFPASATPQSYKVVEEPATTGSTTTTTSSTTSASSNGSPTQSTSTTTTTATTTASPSTTVVAVTAGSSTETSTTTTHPVSRKERGRGKGKAVAKVTRIFREGRQLVVVVQAGQPGGARLKVAVRPNGRICRKVRGRRRCLARRAFLYKTHVRLRRGTQRLHLTIGKGILRLLRGGPVAVQAVVVFDGGESRLQRRIGGMGDRRHR